jgi:N-acetyl-1-D-myo-inositol-2-amino-2-deoxy-alpha-D-glucopyranoside deacetylase
MSGRLLVTVAHPDDETFGCGSLLAHASTRGIETVVACATRGELGEIAAGVEAEPATLGDVREAELRAAARELGVGRVELLGFLDSGMDGEPPPGSLAAADAADVAARLRPLLHELRPDVVVTLDGSDGHRDHAAIRDATLVALRESSWKPARTYLWCLPRSLLSRVTGFETFGTPDDDITTVVDTADLLDRRWRAIRMHASQVPPFDAMPPDLQREFLGSERLRRVDPPWTGGPVETDPFDGLEN